MAPSSGTADPDRSADSYGETASDVTAARPGAAFENLFHTEFPVMFRLATLLGAADAEAVAQEALARLYARWPALTDRSHAGGYLRTTVVNLCRSAARHQAVADHYVAVRAQQDAAQQHATMSAESLALQSVSDEQLLAALRTLSPRHREALVLRFWLDLSESQMAQAMNCSAGSVKSHVSRGLKALRAALDDKGDYR